MHFYGAARQVLVNATMFPCGAVRQILSPQPYTSPCVMEGPELYHKGLGKEFPCSRHSSGLQQAISCCSRHRGCARCRSWAGGGMSGAGGGVSVACTTREVLGCSRLWSSPWSRRPCVAWRSAQDVRQYNGTKQNGKVSLPWGNLRRVLLKESSTELGSEPKHGGWSFGHRAPGWLGSPLTLVHIRRGPSEASGVTDR